MEIVILKPFQLGKYNKRSNYRRDKLDSKWRRYRCNQANITTSGAQLYEDALTLSGSDTFTTTSNGTITFSGAVNGAGTVVLASGTAVDTFDSTVGATTPLTSLTATSIGGLNLSGSVYTTGLQSYGATTLDAAATFSGGNLSFSTINGTSGQNLTIDTTGTSSV